MEYAIMRCTGGMSHCSIKAKFNMLQAAEHPTLRDFLSAHESKPAVVVVDVCYFKPIKDDPADLQTGDRKSG